MTREEILKLEAGTKMNQLVWWKVFDTTPEPPNNDMLFLPNYSGDMLAAWQVVEKMAKISDEHFHDWGIFPLDLADCGGGNYAASFTDGPDDYWRKYDDMDWIEVDDGEFGIAHGETPMLAICRAALLAVMEL